MKHARVGSRSFTAAITVLGLFLVLFTWQVDADAQGADNPAQVAAGQTVYEMSCAGCHGVDGGGVAGLGRPLVGIANQGDRATHVASITDGKGGMPAFGPQLSVEEIDQATSYVRLTFVESAGTADAPTELAVTGVSTTGLAVVGLAAILAGSQLVFWSSRRDS